VLAFFALVIVASLAGMLFLGLSDANTKNAKLTAKLADLQDDYDTLRAKYYNLLGNYSALETDYANILLQSPSSVPNPASAGADNASISRYEALQDLYNKLKTQYNTFVAEYQKLRTETDQRLLRGSAKVFVTPSDPAVMSLVYNITGKTSNTDDSSQYWKDIKAMYEWVNTNIKYREDGLYPVLPYDLEDGLEHSDQMAQFPNETLVLKMGDCEDMAMLLTSMIRAYFNNSYTTESIWITGESAGHVAVQIPFRYGKLVILDPVRDYYSHDTLGDISLNSISTELYNWMSIWRPSLGKDVHVYRIFSDYVDKFFESNEEYLTWMNEGR
jgi:hypothetical protein